MVTLIACTLKTKALNEPHTFLLCLNIYPGSAIGRVTMSHDSARHHPVREMIRMPDDLFSAFSLVDALLPIITYRFPVFLRPCKLYDVLVIAKVAA